MNFAIFPGLHDRRLMREEKCIESLPFSLLITKSHHFQISDNIWALQSVFKSVPFHYADKSYLGIHYWDLSWKVAYPKLKQVWNSNVQTWEMEQIWADCPFTVDTWGLKPIFEAKNTKNSVLAKLSDLISLQHVYPWKIWSTKCRSFCMISTEVSRPLYIY